MSSQSTRHHQHSPRWWQRFHKPVAHVALVPQPVETARALKAAIAEPEDVEPTEELKTVAAEPETPQVPYLGIEGGHIAQRPGSEFHDTLLAPCNPHPQLSNFTEGNEVRLNDLAGAEASGLYGRVSRVVPWRAVRPIGVRVHAEGWGRLLWCEPHELELLNGPYFDTLTMTVGSYL